MDLRLIEALIVFLQTAAITLAIWNRAQIAKVRTEMNGKLHQLIAAEKKVSFVEGKIEGGSKDFEPNHFPGP